MIKKINTMLVIAIALAPISVHAEDAPSNNGLKKKILTAVGVTAGVAVVIGGIALYAKKRSSGQRLGSSGAAKAPVAVDAVEKSAAEKAVGSAVIRALEARMKALEEASAQHSASVATVRQELQQGLQDKASRTSVERLLADISKRPTDDEMRTAHSKLATKVALQENMSQRDEELGKLTEAVVGLVVFQTEYDRDKKGRAELKAKVSELDERTKSVEARLSDVSARQANLSLRVDEGLQIQEAQQQEGGASGRRVQFGPDSIHVMSPRGTHAESTVPAPAALAATA